MNDIDATLHALADEVMSMCRRKGWGENGVQNPQHVAMAMLVETLELLEHFAVDTPRIADDKKAEIGEEMADVMMYSLQLMRVVGFSVAPGINQDFSDELTPIAALKTAVGRASESPKVAAMRIATEARFVLEVFQWMKPEEVRALMKGKIPDARDKIGRAFTCEFIRLLALAELMDIDISRAITRKIAIVDKRVYGSDEPVR